MDKGLVGEGSRGDRGRGLGRLEGDDWRPGGGGPWHAAGPEVYHNNPSCQTGDKFPYGEGERLNGAGGLVGNLIGL